MKTEIKMIPVKLLEQNRGQVSGLPKNPRFFRDYRYEAMVKSMRDCPEMLELRELIVFPNGDKFVTVCGNLRLRGGRELGLKEMPCKVLPADTPVKKLCEYAAKDNISYGEDDMDISFGELMKGFLSGDSTVDVSRIWSWVVSHCFETVRQNKAYLAQMMILLLAFVMLQGISGIFADSFL